MSVVTAGTIEFAAASKCTSKGQVLEMYFQKELNYKPYLQCLDLLQLH